MNRNYTVLTIVLVEIIAVCALVWYFNQPKESTQNQTTNEAVVPTETSLREELQKIYESKSEQPIVNNSEVIDDPATYENKLQEMWTHMLDSNNAPYADEVQERIDQWSKKEPSLIKQKVEELATLYKSLVNPANTDDQYLVVLQRISGIEGCLVFSGNSKYEKMLDDRNVIIENQNHIDMMILRQKMLQKKPTGLKLPFNSPEKYRNYCMKFLKGKVAEPPLDEFTF